VFSNVFYSLFWINLIQLRKVSLLVINSTFNSYFSLSTGGMKPEYMEEIYRPAASHCQS